MDAARARTTLWLCTAAALLEGYDNQSAGVAAPRMLPEFGLGSGQAGLVFSAAALGLFAGAAIGGRVADHLGRKRTLALSLLMFGLFSLLTTVSVGYHSLVAARFLTGLGLGGAMPNFIALASQAVARHRRVIVVVAVTAALPLGGAIAGLTALADRWGWNWRTIFYVGGVAPLALSLLSWLQMPEDRANDAAATTIAAAPQRIDSVPQVLFGGGRLPTTLTMWGGFFFTQLILLLMLNWLPTLLVSLGFSKAQGSIAATVFNLAGSAGSLALGWLQPGRLRAAWVLATYVGIAAGLWALPAAGQSFALAMTACAFAGACIIGAQLLLFASAPLYYRRAVQGTGVGLAVAIGRLGSVVGPMFAGVLLAGGSGGAGVLIGILPFVAVAGTSTLALATRPIESG